MEPDVAIKWVRENKVIASHARRLEAITAYEARDYMQNAIMAALKANLCVPDVSSEAFRRTFWGIFKKHNVSRSIPSVLCTCDESALFGVHDTGREPKVDYCNVIFRWGSPALTAQESKVLKLALGLDQEGSEGKLSEREIAKKLKINRQRAHQLLTSAINKIVSLIEEGDTRFILRILFDAIKDSFHHSS